jgi:hypothetical protein
MEELALFALPPSYRGAETDDPDSDNANDGADSRSDETSFPIFSVSGSTDPYREPHPLPKFMARYPLTDGSNIRTTPTSKVHGSNSSDRGELVMADPVLQDFAAKYIHT